MFPLHTRISPLLYFFFFFNDTATTEIYTLSLHDVFRSQPGWRGADCALACRCAPGPGPWLVGRAGRQPGAPAHAAARHRGPGREPDAVAPGPVQGLGRGLRRSEERRVGKECRSRWWPDH